MSSHLKRIRKRLDGVGGIPKRVIGCGTVFSCLVILFSALLFAWADDSHARAVAAGVLDSGVWVFAESIIGGLLMQSYSEKHSKN